MRVGIIAAIVAGLLMHPATSTLADGVIIVVLDDDGDGVPDDAGDACLGTPAGDLVSADGCSVCDCEAGDWTSHAEYLRCVRAEATVRYEAGSLSGRAAHQVVKRARWSTCGNADLTRCCFYENEDDEKGRCRIMSEDRCDDAIDRLDEADGQREADDAGPGSCLEPTPPCAY